MSDPEFDRYLVARSSLLESCNELEPGAMEVLAFIAALLVVGRKCYGDLELSTDKRDWAKEMAQESADLVVYNVCSILSKAMKEIDHG